ncbi:cytochrome c biogenesis protein DipZ [Legionella shakespearei]|nr:cytochrome c biogenesis protein DipZ [Legionella shakespearei]
MNTDLLTVLAGFLEGFVLILSPCILSILPIILAGSLSGSRRRSFGIIIGFIFVFALFALFARQLISYWGIDSSSVRYTAYGLLFLFALILFSNYLTEQFNRLTQRFGSIGSAIAPHQEERGFWGGVLLGGLVAIIWTPCAGPILATIIVQIVIQQTNLMSFFTLLAFAAGAAIPMLIIALYGFKIRELFPVFKRHAGLTRKILAVILFLNLGFMIAQEKGLISSSIIEQTPIRTANFLEQGVWRPYEAPEIGGIESWINSSPLNLTDLQGKVVLVDFWTYSCINCVRTLPYLKDWYNKYHDQGLVIIGIHTPEFDFEKEADNVRAAVKHYGIHYPVALDNSFTTWQNFSNHFWPAHYLINKDGKVVYEHFGEGNYDVTENNIRFLLGLNKTNTPMPIDSLASYFITPETYLGYKRADVALSPEIITDQTKTYQFPASLTENAWALAGEWLVQSDKITSQGNAALKFHFKAGKVFIVMGKSGNKPIPVKLFLNGKPLIENKGKDVVDGTVVVDKYGLYEVVDLKQSESGVLELRTEAPGLELYTFTFGG